ncbi:hypothetical protein, variant [Aphanomyces astaci]|uniref:Cullin family profile domain-containing protein n=1 Tax=Aphanomyces astaci TaxID=112090 RepID=W4FC28_APHAT|nr:hypothetical protein, variant [Aphanomyces astaci]ETV65032.1 hypothetical protein, variant [Aphanomyces astaci]|eukprot:XP_009845495.1 hypothetical protein, variant [Aphanomyces astaci]
MSAPARPGGNEQVPFLQEDFHAFPFQSQRMLVELQTNTFRDTSAVEFWAKLSHDATENATHLPHALAYAVETIRQLEEITQCVPRIQQHPPSRSLLSLLKAHFRAILFHDARQTQVFCDALEALCTSIFVECTTTDPDAATAKQEAAVTLRRHLHYLEWMHIAKPCILAVFLRQIDHRVATVCRANFVDSFFDDIEAWVDSTLLQDAHTMFATNLHGHDSSQHNVEYVITLKQHAVRAFGTLRGRELFDIVRDFPDSLPAIQDLTKCLQVTHQQAEIVSTFQRAIQSRVLQPGASTTSILGVYTRTIKTFRHLDPRGVLVQSIRDLFSHYLRKRKDTIRCIVTSLTDQESGELYEELSRDRRVEPVIDSDDDDDEIEATDEWQPQPLDVAPTGRHVDDLLSSLVGIYGNPSAFVNEYRMMLAERLLMSTDFNTDRDVHTLELLKLRFGDVRLQPCDIMLKDMEESKRVHANLGLAVDATVVSEHFWPPFQGDEFTLHPRLEAMVQTYKDAYAVLKNPRQLDWVSYLGVVELEIIDLNGHTIEFTVSPMQATVLSYFEDQGRGK